MKNLTLELDCFLFNELKDYLLLISGIEDVSITNDVNLVLNIQYKPELISMFVILKEVLYFLDCLKISSLLSFDKHSKEERKSFSIPIKDYCCEYCFKGLIEDLFATKGIEKVTTNFCAFENRKEDLVLNIFYQSNLINENEVKKLSWIFYS